MAEKKTAEKPNKSSIAKRFKKKFSPIVWLEVAKISVMPEIFQGRTVPFAKATVEKIKKEGFDTSQEPIILYRFKREKDIVISGHSRFEAAKKLKIKIIPVKYFKGSFDDAIDYAVIESNRSGKSEGIESDVKAYIRAKERGYNKDFMRSIFKSDSYINTLDRLSYLNPKGRFVDNLAKTSALSIPYLKRNAVWVGTLRKKHKKLSNAQENEIFDFFYSSEVKNLKITKEKFFNLIQKKVDKPNFNGRVALSLLDTREFKKIPKTDAGYKAYKTAQSKESSFHQEHERLLKKAVEFLNVKNLEKGMKFINDAKNIDERIKEQHTRVIALRKKLKLEDKRLAKGLF